MSVKKLSVCGSRTLGDERVKIILLEAVEKYNPEYIVTHAEPSGVCEIAKTVAKECGIPLTLHYLNFKYLRGAFEHRSVAVFKDSDYCVFIHDGKSKGCRNEKTLADKMKIPYDYHKLVPYEKPVEVKSVGFDPDEEPWNFEK